MTPSVPPPPSMCPPARQPGDHPAPLRPVLPLCPPIPPLPAPPPCPPRTRMEASCARTVAPNHCRDLNSTGSGGSVLLPPKSWVRVPGGGGHTRADRGGVRVAPAAAAPMGHPPPGPPGLPLTRRDESNSGTKATGWGGSGHGDSDVGLGWGGLLEGAGGVARGPMGAGGRVPNLSPHSDCPQAWGGAVPTRVLIPVRPPPRVPIPRGVPTPPCPHPHVPVLCPRAWGGPIPIPTFPPCPHARGGPVSPLLPPPCPCPPHVYPPLPMWSNSMGVQSSPGGQGQWYTAPPWVTLGWLVLALGAPTRMLTLVGGASGMLRAGGTVPRGTQWPSPAERITGGGVSRGWDDLFAPVSPPPPSPVPRVPLTQL